MVSRWQGASACCCTFGAWAPFHLCSVCVRGDGGRASVALVAKTPLASKARRCWAFVLVWLFSRCRAHQVDVGGRTRGTWWASSSRGSEVGWGSCGSASCRRLGANSFVSQRCFGAPSLSGSPTPDFCQCVVCTALRGGSGERSRCSGRGCWGTRSRCSGRGPCGGRGRCGGRGPCSGGSPWGGRGWCGGRGLCGRYGGRGWCGGRGQYCRSRRWGGRRRCGGHAQCSGRAP